ncbi:MAG: PTS glucose transporter subunit IIA [Actinomycetota bacterium]|nr:PTS glucose transporter subunit IIA [Actinomycetota bacterium]
MSRPVLTVCAPVPGWAQSLAEVPDPVFAAALVGPGVAVDPERGPLTARAPVSGWLATLHPHAYVVIADDERGVLVHLGIDTVQLAGAGFELLAAQGDRVAAGGPVIEWDAARIAAGGRSPVCPVVALDAAPEAVSRLAADGVVPAGAELFGWR